MTTQTAPRHRLIGLDGLRGFLALCVILVHVTAHYAPSILAMTHVEVLGQAIVVFFALSGFLIYTPFARAIVEGRDPLQRIGAYVRARVFRVFPAYLLVFLLANLAGAVYLDNAMVVQAHSSEGGTGSITDPLSLLLHLTLVQNYVPSQLQTGINSSWTLTVELAFYLLLPFLAALVVACAARVAPHANRMLIAAVPGIALIVVGLTSRIVGIVWASSSDLSAEMGEWGPNMLAVFSRSILPWADNFGWGMLATVLYLALRRGDLSPKTVVRVRHALWVVAPVGVAVSGACYFLMPRLIAAAFAVAGTAVLLLLILPVDGVSRVFRLARWIDNPVLHWLGTTSLSIYLWHYPVIILLERWGFAGGDTWAGWAWSFALVTGVSVALASVTYLLVEKPSMSLGAARRREKKVAA